MRVIGLRTTVEEHELIAAGVDWLIEGLSQVHFARMEQGKLRLEIRCP
jgi:hypothetical protein